MSVMKIPFVDLYAQYLRYQPAIDAAIRSTIERSAYIGGESVRQFEREFAAAFGVKHCVACGNGTDAIYIVLKMLGIGAGDEVITTASSWISTSETISQAGATPVFVDVDDYFCIDVDQVAAKISPRTKAIIPVHLYGQAAQVERLAQLAADADIRLIEDCAQAHFAERAGKKVGGFGDAATFSFYPGKNLGAYGDAGAIVTNDDELAQRCRRYANHGALVKHQHDIEGINSRLDGLQAAILSAKLPHLSDWTLARQSIARKYDRLLGAIQQVEIPKVCAGSTHVYHLYVIRAPRRDELRQYLSARGVETSIHYPSALPLLDAYRYLGMSEREIPRAAQNAKSILSLPMYAELTDSMIEYVTDSIHSFYSIR